MPAEPAENRTPSATPPGTFRIGTIAGSDVLISSSWFLVAGLIAVLMAPRVEQISPGLGAWKYLVGVVFAVVLYLAVLLHEASHAAVATRYGFRVHSITLHFLGGVTAIEGESRNPRQEFWIAVVGPITSIGIGLVGVALWFVTPEGLLLLTVQGMAGANLIIGVLNLVPGLPLDGGRVLKAAVWGLTGSAVTGTTAAGWGGRLAAVAVLGWPLLAEEIFDQPASLVDALIAVVIAVFLWTGATQAMTGARIRDRLTGVVARDLARRTLTVPADLPLAEAVRRAQASESGGIVTTSPTGAPLGLVDEAAVLATPEERRPWVPVSSVARSLDGGLRLPVDITGRELLEAIQRSPAGQYLLVEADGGLYGVLATADVERAVTRR
ncbi:site-2 protease family protein [Nocardioides panacisoli]|uniref:site-2 protease family protein n=1 Tax=Nocardioides panacisoli TaxID=627624 RepID=UPI001C630FB1|nr:site-2 protease family protein [Nocardioides panacisoli]QYJ05042.1 site-2 protease family protein [Nocardioides panacisoli]